ncbi:MAG: hypothetical protein K6T86_00680 [Pirellulales bacterium]|nr:hypothetical protein [Pirellulales bacterium]
MSMVACNPAVLGQPPQPGTPAADKVRFEEHVLPILQAHCLACHSASRSEGGLVLETPEAIRSGGSRGPAVVPGNPVDSLLLALTSGRTEPAMPPPDNQVGAEPLGDAELEVLRRWIEEGASGSVSSRRAAVRWRQPPAAWKPGWAVRFSSDDALVAFSRGTQLFVYQTQTGRLVAQLADPALASGQADRDGVRAIAFDPTGELLAAGGYKTIRVWRRPRDVRRWQWSGAEPQQEGMADGGAARPSAGVLAASPDGRLVAVVVGDAQIHLLAAVDGRLEGVLRGHAAGISQVRFSADGQVLYAAWLDGTVRVWSVESSRQLRRLITPAPVRHLALVDETHIATSSGDGYVQYWALQQPASQRIARLSAPATSLVVSPARSALVSGQDGRLRRLTLEDLRISTVARGEAGHLERVALWPDGSRAAFAPAVGRVEVASLDANEILQTLRLGQARVADLAVHPEGRRVVVATDDGALRLWQLDAEAAALCQNEARPTAAALSYDGRWLATAEEIDGRPAAVVRDLEQGATTHLLLGHTKQIRALAFSPDAQRLATAADDGTVRVWDLADRRMPELAHWPAHDQQATAVCFVDQQTLLTAEADGRVCLWNMHQLASPLTVAAHQGSVTGMALHQSNVITVGSDGVLRTAPLSDLGSARTVPLAGPAVALAMASGASRAAVAVRFAPQPPAADPAAPAEAATGQNRQEEAGHQFTDRAGIQVIDLETLRVIQTITTATDGQGTPPHALALDSQGTLVAAADANGVHAWDVPQGLLLSALDVPPCNALFWQPGSQVLCVAAEGSVLRTALPVARVAAAHAGRGSVAWSADGSRIVSAGEDGRLLVWDGELRPAFAAELGSAGWDVAVSPTGNVLAAACDDGRIRLLEQNGSPARELTGFTAPVTCVAFSSDGRFAAGGDAAGQVRLFEVQEGRCVQAYASHTAAVTGVGIDVVDSQQQDAPLRVISCSSDGTIRRHALLATRRIRAHDDPLTAMEAVGDGRLFTADAAGRVREWNAEAQLVRQLELGAAVRALAVRPDGARLIAGGENGAARLWNLEDGQLLGELQGDFRLAAEAAKLARQAESLQLRLSAHEELLAQAQNDAQPRASEAESRQTAFAAAERDHAQRMATLRSAMDAWQQAQAAAFAATRQARQAQRALADAMQQVTRLEQAAARAAQRAEQARSAAAAKRDDEKLAQAAEAAEHDSQRAAERLNQARESLAAAEERAATLAPMAAEAQARAAALAAEADQAQQAAQQAMEAMREARRLAEDAQAAYRQAQTQLENGLAIKSMLQQSLEEVRTRQQSLEAEFQTSLRTVTAAAFLPPGVVATTGESGAIYLWQDDTGRPADVIEAGTLPVHVLAFVAGGVASMGGLTAAAWELEPAWPLHRVLGGEEADVPADRVLALEFSPDGTLLAAAGGDPSRSGELMLWEAASGRLIAHLPQAHSDTVLAAAFSPDGRYLATGGADRLVKVFSVPELRELQRFEGHAHHVLAVAWRSDGERLASAGAEGVVRIWNPLAGEPLLAIEGFAKPVTALRFLPGSSTVISGCGDKLLRQHEIDGGNLLRTWEAADYVNALDLTANAQLLAAIEHSGSLRIWHFESGQLVHLLPPDTQDVQQSETVPP